MRCMSFRFRPAHPPTKHVLHMFFRLLLDPSDPPTETYETFLGFTTPTKHEAFRGLSYRNTKSVSRLRGWELALFAKVLELRKVVRKNSHFKADIYYVILINIRCYTVTRTNKT
jgi:hypothetical protein